MQLEKLFYAGYELEGVKGEHGALSAAAGENLNMCVAARLGVTTEL